MFRDPACSTFRKILIASVFSAGMFLIPGGVQSATSNSATLQWAANQEPDLAGYRVYHGTTPGNYGSPRDAGMTSSYQYNNLESNKTHYFSVTAVDEAGNESPPSPEVSKAIPGLEQLAEEQRVAEAARLAEEQRVAVAARLAEQQRVAEAARLAEQQRVVEAARLQEQQRLAKVEKLERKKLAQAAKQERKQLAKAKKLLDKIQKGLAKIEQKLATHADNPKVVSHLSRNKVKLLAKRDEIQKNYSIN